MRLTYDPESGMAYLYLQEKPSGEAFDRSVELDDDELPDSLVVDIDREGRLIGIEIFGADHCLSPQLREQAERP
jgi:uncharacterized protein YuzE